MGELGIKIFDEKNVEWYDWFAFGIFVIAWSVYNHYAILKSMKNSGKQFCFMITCCRINKDIESRFDTPFFDTSRFQQQQQQRSPNSHSSLPEIIDKKLYIQDHESQNKLQQQQENNNYDDENIKDVGF